MNLIGAIIGGSLGGFIGAAVWAGIAYKTGYEIGWIAWAIGGIVGFCVGVGSNGKGNKFGIIAVIITILSLLGGKYATVELLIQKELGNESEFLQSAIDGLDEEMTVSYVADEIIVDLESAGTEIAWPNVENLSEEPSIKEGYPAQIWTQAEERWNAKSEQEKETYRNEIVESMRQNMHLVRDYISRTGFMESFGLMDLIFFALAIGTAYKVAAET